MLDASVTTGLNTAHLCSSQRICNRHSHMQSMSGSMPLPHMPLCQCNAAYREVQNLPSNGGFAGVNVSYEHYVHVLPALSAPHSDALLPTSKVYTVCSLIECNDAGVAWGLYVSLHSIFCWAVPQSLLSSQHRVNILYRHYQCLINREQHQTCSIDA